MNNLYLFWKSEKNDDCHESFDWHVGPLYTFDGKPMIVRLPDDNGYLRFAWTAEKKTTRFYDKRKTAPPFFILIFSL